jgi:hypothetical protein
MRQVDDAKHYGLLVEWDTPASLAVSFGTLISRHGGERKSAIILIVHR